MSNIDRFKIKPGSHLKLDSIDPAYHAGHKDKASAKDEIHSYESSIETFNERLNQSENRLDENKKGARGEGVKEKEALKGEGWHNPPRTRIYESLGLQGEILQATEQRRSLP